MAKAFLTRYTTRCVITSRSKELRENDETTTETWLMLRNVLSNKSAFAR